LQRSGTVPGIGLVHAPFSLLPSPFPRQAFSQAIELAPLFNLLADRVSQDAEFLQQTLARYLMSTLKKKRSSWIPLRATYFLLH
jgi:glutathione synthase